MYDPDLTGTGHQPTGHDQWANFYKRYLVFGSKCKIKVIQNSTGTTMNFYLIPATMPSMTTAPTFIGDPTIDPVELKYCKKLLLPGYSVANPTGPKVLSHYTSTKKMYGQTMTPMADFGGLTGGIGTGTNPAYCWAWVLYGTVFGFNDSVGVAASMSFTVDMEVTYYAKYYDKQFVAES